MPTNDRRFDDFSKTGLVNVIQAMEKELAHARAEASRLANISVAFSAAPLYRRVWLALRRRVS